MKQQIAHIVNNLDLISLSEMEAVSLMKRTDTKFVIHQKQLIDVLESIKNQYKVLEINGNRLLTYSSLYFDTENKKFYHDHHNGKINRTKVRMRKYMESNSCFLEIKQKDGKGKTTKSRIQINDFETDLPQDLIDFINSKINKKMNLKPIIWNKFNRITLVNKYALERLTIDLNLEFEMNANSKTFNNLAIIEVKQQRLDRTSPVVKSLKEKGINPYSISKYCIGMTNIYPNLKYNSFKCKILKLNKITA
ncbi:polyphosphate polymerase domain-containing protein [Lutibacter sp. HS1-25]|uniref:polyphosphate polymerase domain-containing protein n=1 Tax=Lutibacter sp. HS1-25 TaxID=2485000 RepID=UPI001011C2E7|nr:polyphosphate polymerase domain-containing protein [Lutibacter sp. HS1-25]RXP64516.1 polyphosphate polymerase domain-containing protein [Lutibacter sp. HS1-25]